MNRLVPLAIGLLVVVGGGWLVVSPITRHVPTPASQTKTPIDAATLSGHPGLYFLDAGNLTGTLSTDHFSAYQDLQDDGKIGKGSTIITDQNLPVSSQPSAGTITGAKTGLGLVGGGTAGAVTVALNPGVSLTFSNGQLVATLGDSIDLNSNETVSVLPVAKGGTGLATPPPTGAVLVGTSTGYTYGLLSDGDGTKLVNASGQLGYNVDSSVCRTTGNCAGAGGGITGSGTPNHLARFSSAGTLSDSILYDTGSALGIGTTDPKNTLDVAGGTAVGAYAGLSTAPTNGLIVSGNVGIGTDSPTATLDIRQQAGTLIGPELVTNGSFDTDATGWNLGSCGGNWESSQLTLNYTNACGNADLTTDITVTAGHTYQLSFDITAESNEQVYVYTSKSYGSADSLSVGHHTYTFVATDTGSGTIWFENWNWNDPSSWSIDNVSVKETTQSQQLLRVASADGTSWLQLADDNLHNLGFGKAALSANTSGGDNIAIGSNALAANGDGFQNVAVGNGALSSNTGGYYNTAIGGLALSSSTTGKFNSALGFDTLAATTTGMQNSGYGSYSLALNSTGSGNSGFGHTTLRNNTTGSYNTAMGYTALYFNNGQFNVGIGASTLFANASGSNNTALGYAAGRNGAGG